VYLNLLASNLIMNLKYCTNRLAMLLSAMLISPSLFAQGFGAGISPSKFELRAKPGTVLRDTVTIVNAGTETAEFKFSTVDWEMNESQGPDFVEDRLLENSCRPWVRLERKVAQIRPAAQKKYRFEIHVPEDSGPGLCKFALLIQPAESATASVGQGDQQIKFPVVGRYAAMVYVTIGDAKAEIEFLGIGEQLQGEQRLPTLMLSNSGNTLDRTFGQITATDADGKRHVLIPSNFPILPGRTEAVLLSPEQQRNREPVEVVLNYPLKLKGKFEIGGQSFSVDEVFN
jgi:fimbrial chaperone protein